MQLDLIIENADIVTMDARRPRADRVGVLHGRVVGLDEEIDGCSAARRYDAAGSCLLPGFIDAHTHLELTGQALSAVDVAHCATADDVLQVIAASAPGLAAEDWLDDTDVDRAHSAAAERGAAMGVVVGLIAGIVAGWAIGPVFDELAGRSATVVGIAFIGAAIGLAVGSFAGMEQGQPARDPGGRR